MTGRKSRSSWAYALGGLACVATAALLAFGQWRPDLLLVEHVEFEGAGHAEQASLRHLADLRNGTRIWEVDLDRMAEGVARHPWVKSARARTEWPATVVVEIEEYRPVATTLWDGRLVYVDAEGVPFVAARSDDLDYPVVTGLDSELEAAHPALPRLVLRDALALLSRLDEARLVPPEAVSEVAFDRDRGFDVVLSGGARLAFDLGGHDRQIERLAALLDRGVDLDQHVLVDLVPAKVAIVRPLSGPGEG